MFQEQLGSTTDPDKKQMLERLDAAVTSALQPLQVAVEEKAAAEVLQPLAQVRLSCSLEHLQLFHELPVVFFKHSNTVL